MPTQTLALLIDAANAQPNIISGLLAEVANYGTASVKRVYGDWTKPNLNGLLGGLPRKAEAINQA